MAALLRQGGRRIGGYVLQRTQAAVTSPAVAEERRLLMPRRITTDARPSEKEVLEMKEELYVALSKGKNLRNRGLLQHLALHVNPKPEDPQWSRMRVARTITDFVEAAGTGVFVSLVVLHGVYGIWAAMKQMGMERENQLKQMEMERENQWKQVALEWGNQVETD